MSNWTSITIDDLKATGHGAIIDSAQTTAIGATDPIPEALMDAVSRVRGAISVGNQLDRDTFKIPRSLKALAVRIALFALMERIQFALTDDQRDTKRNDQSYLNRIIDEKIRFEQPDTPAGSAEMQQGMSVGIITSTPRQASRQQLSGLM